jgi:FKBP-type peptidyl-prolyl cis-trans isomerase
MQFRLLTVRAGRVLGAVALLAACRPDGYVAPPPEAPEVPEDPLPVAEDELTHQALFGGDFASAAVLTPPPSATISPSGLTSVVLRKGQGQASPAAADTVVVRFTGWDSRGQRFDSTQQRGKPDRLGLGDLVPGWREAMETMVPGEKRRLWIPERLAFGSLPAPGRPAGDIVVDVELVEIVAAPPLPVVPPDLKEPPADAVTRPSGLRYKVLSPGKGSDHPVRGDSVVVHYSGWTLDGVMFDSSVARGQSISFGVEDVIPGWTELLLLMTPGERTRVWIPAALAYGETPARPGAPAGPLVFDVELIEIQKASD